MHTHREREMERDDEWVSVTTTCLRIEAIASQTVNCFATQLVTIIWSLLCYVVYLHFAFNTIMLWLSNDKSAMPSIYVAIFFSLLLFFAHSDVVNGAWHFGPDKVLVPFKFLPNDCRMLNGTRSYWTTRIKSNIGAWCSILITFSFIFTFLRKKNLITLNFYVNHIELIEIYGIVGNKVKKNQIKKFLQSFFLLRRSKNGNSSKKKFNKLINDRNQFEM